MRIKTGTSVLDELLEGGLETDTITIIYGPAGSGKTNFCLHAAINMLEKIKKLSI